jgi:hypothetical protein
MKKLSLCLFLFPLLMAKPIFAEPPAAAPPPAAAAPAKEEPPAAVTGYFKMMMGALEDKDYNAFITPLDDNARGMLSKDMFDKVLQTIGPKLASGYDTKYLDSARHDDSMVYLWKLTFKDKPTDFVAVMSTKGNKVMMFFLL